MTAEAATPQNPARLDTRQIAELRGIHGSVVDKLIADGTIVEQKGGQYAANSRNQN